MEDCREALGRGNLVGPTAAGLVELLIRTVLAGPLSCALRSAALEGLRAPFCAEIITDGMEMAGIT